LPEHKCQAQYGKRGENEIQKNHRRLGNETSSRNASGFDFGMLV
jgi:hypothetical protein